MDTNLHDFINAWLAALGAAECIYLSGRLVPVMVTLRHGRLLLNILGFLGFLQLSTAIHTTSSNSLMSPTTKTVIGIVFLVAVPLLAYMWIKLSDPVETP